MGEVQFAMQIWPAIDLRGGKCVRLAQGDYQRETVFGEDPVGMARHWVAQGAQFLHLVDLDGAREGRPVHLEVVRHIVQATGIPCELGGGVRDEHAIRSLLGIGVDRVVLGTKAIRDPEWFRRIVRLFPHKLVLGIDARDGRVATDGWLKTSDVGAVDLAKEFADEPMAAIIYTDIARDGMLNGPNFDAMAAMQQAVETPVIASGGVSVVDDVARLARLGLAGCIVGRALYENRLTLAQALSVAGDGAPRAKGG